MSSQSFSQHPPHDGHGSSSSASGSRDGSRRPGEVQSARRGGAPVPAPHSETAVSQADGAA
ncbi:MAG: hypothetical protein ACJ8AD_11840 [Gemmatimonadaceae bacterium]